MTKEVTANKYSDVFYEITKDLLYKASFDENVLDLLDDLLFSYIEIPVAVADTQKRMSEVAATAEVANAYIDRVSEDNQIK